jgi:fructose-bisphosphate aldolase, class II
MKALREVLDEARQTRVAIGHFNISDLAGLKAVFESARTLHVPVIVGLSEGERDFMGVREAAAVVKVLRQDYDYPIFLNADHTHSLASAEDAARAGFDSIVFDRSELPFAQNISETKRAVEALKAINPAILIEGEIGEIGTGSEIHEEAPQGLTLTTTEEARRVCQRNRYRHPGTRCGEYARLITEHDSGRGTKTSGYRPHCGNRKSDRALHDTPWRFRDER